VNNKTYRLSQSLMSHERPTPHQPPPELASGELEHNTCYGCGCVPSRTETGLWACACGFSHVRPRTAVNR
jgi:hypothetical protein